jgi:pimeloyl-ACP methyl ester carboxylesterase
MAAVRGRTRMRAVVTVLSVGAMVAGVTGTAVARQDTARLAPADVDATQDVAWGDCDQETLAEVAQDQRNLYSCATYRVPIDHDNAALGTVDLALLRRTAADPEARIGSLFLNPGGPGGAGRTMPMAAESFFERPVLDRFDIIGFDPRGVGQSNAVRCFTTAEDAEDVLGSQVSVPVSRQDISRTLGAYRDYAQFCQRNSDALLGHMSTRAVARDLDLLRAAVGDEKLTYVGFSYGTLVGATYANLFPQRARALVLDGNVDPQLRTNDGRRYDRERARGFEIALDAFFRECQQVGERCAFSPGQPQQKFDNLRNHLRGQPIPLPGGKDLDLAAFINGVAGSLYSPRSFTGLAQDLQDLHDVVNVPEGTAAKTLAEDDLQTVLDPGADPRFDVRPDSKYTADDAYFAVNCSDKRFRHTLDELPAIAGQWEKESPVFGRAQAFADPAGCPVWPDAAKPGAYRGPWNAKTENPVLVIGNYYDPATQYEFSERMASRLGYARLLSVDAFGHCILGGSAGVDRATTEYLVDLTVPAPGQVYEADSPPFG